MILPHARIAAERFRDEDFVPVESIFQTCMFCILALELRAADFMN